MIALYSSKNCTMVRLNVDTVVRFTHGNRYTMVRSALSNRYTMVRFALGKR